MTHRAMVSQPNDARLSVTCYCDASWNKQGGAWAVWIRSDLGRIVRHGRCPRYVKNSGDAELAAIYAAIFLAVDAWGDRVGKLLIRGDCQSALALAVPEQAAPSKRYATKRLREKIADLIRSQGIRIETRWVKGHQQPSRSTAAYLNHQCDVLAWKARRAARGPRKLTTEALKHGT